MKSISYCYLIHNKMTSNAQPRINALGHFWYQNIQASTERLVLPQNICSLPVVGRWYRVNTKSILKTRFLNV